jgi:hypothetical protein
MSTPGTARPTDRVLCELPRGRSLIRVSESTLPSGVQKVTLCLWYRDVSGREVPSHSLSLDVGEARRLGAALRSLRQPRATSPRAARTLERRAPAITPTERQLGGAA